MPTKDPIKKRLQAQRYREQNRDALNEKARLKYKPRPNRVYKKRTKEKQKEYSLRWRTFNHAHLKSLKQNYYQRNKERIKAKSSLYYENHKTERSIKSKAYQQKNRIRVNEIARKNYHKNLEENRAKARNYGRAYYQKNRENLLASAIEKQAFKRSIKKLASKEEKKKISNFVKITKACDFIDCPYCGTKIVGKSAHFDHVVPLSLGGRHELKNLTPACGPCNISKGNRLLEDWQVTKS